METNTIVRQSLEYIEENLKTELSPEDIASWAGYSLYYYYRAFQKEVGMPVMQYIVYRRLSYAIYEMGQGMKAIDAALMYGFDTHAGFFKAFKRYYDCSPSEYLKKIRPKKPNPLGMREEGDKIMTYKNIKTLLANWGFENETIADMYYEGTRDKNDRAYYIGENYVLQSVSHIGAIKSHIEVAKSLELQGLLSPVAIPTKDGRLYISEGSCFIALAKRLKGDQVKAKDFYTDQEGIQAYRHGQMIGQLHKGLRGHEQIICNDNNMIDTVCGWALPETQKHMAIDEVFILAYVDTFKSLYDSLPRQIIHRNPHPGNIIVQEGEFVGFMNFELSERNIRLFDPCYAATAILADCFEVGNDEKCHEWLPIYRQIIRGYDEMITLSKEEKQAIPYVLIAIQLIFVAYCHGQQNLEGLAKVNEEMLSWMIREKDKLAIE